MVVTSVGPVSFQIRRGAPVLAGDMVAASHGVRRERELAAVNAAADPSSGRAVYWTFGDVARRGDRKRLLDAPVTYDLTFMSPRTLGQQLPRTHGHVHASEGPDGAGFAEVYEVLSGRAGFLMHDLGPGPSVSLGVLVNAEPGDVVAVPPDVYHATLNLGPTMLVVADLVCRRATDVYVALRAAGGMAYGLDAAGRVAVNPRYHRLPPLQRLSVEEWGAGMKDGLYERLLMDPGAFEWLCHRAAFATRFPKAARWVGSVVD
jgi:glucose-6-phosphate isomerase